MLKNQTIVVMGAAGLIGKQIVACCLKNGAQVVAADINGAALAEIEKLHASEKLHVSVVDLTQKESIQQCLDDSLKKFDQVTGLVNAAYPRNSNYGKSFFDVTYEDFCENSNLNIATTFSSSQTFAKYFSDQKSGSIINLGSIYGVMAPDFSIYQGTEMTMPVEYAAIKSAIIHLTKYMANYTKKDGVRINCISPGGILDNQPDSFLEKYNQKAGKLGMLNSEHLDSTVLYLLSDTSSAITGQNIVVDDGFSL